MRSASCPPSLAAGLFSPPAGTQSPFAALVIAAPDSPLRIAIILSNCSDPQGRIAIMPSGVPAAHRNLNRLITICDQKLVFCHKKRTFFRSELLRLSEEQ